MGESGTVGFSSSASLLRPAYRDLDCKKTDVVVVTPLTTTTTPLIACEKPVNRFSALASPLGRSRWMAALPLPTTEGVLGTTLLRDARRRDGVAAAFQQEVRGQVVAEQRGRQVEARVVEARHVEARAEVVVAERAPVIAAVSTVDAAALNVAAQEGGTNRGTILLNVDGAGTLTLPVDVPDQDQERILAQWVLENRLSSPDAEGALGTINTRRGVRGTDQSTEARDPRGTLAALTKEDMAAAIAAALVRMSAGNVSGRFRTFTVPNEAAMSALLEQALAHYQPQGPGLTRSDVTDMIDVIAILNFRAQIAAGMTREQAIRSYDAAMGALVGARYADMNDPSEQDVIVVTPGRRRGIEARLRAVGEIGQDEYDDIFGDDAGSLLESASYESPGSAKRGARAAEEQGQIAFAAYNRRVTRIAARDEQDRKQLNETLVADAVEQRGSFARAIALSAGGDNDDPTFDNRAAALVSV